MMPFTAVSENKAYAFSIYSFLEGGKKQNAFTKPQVSSVRRLADKGFVLRSKKH